MAGMLVVRRADGDLFTEELSGQPCIPVRSSRDACARHRTRNPELLTDLPARPDDSPIKRIAGSPGGAGRATFFVVAGTRRTLTWAGESDLPGRTLAENIALPSATAPV